MAEYCLALPILDKIRGNKAMSEEHDKGYFYGKNNTRESAEGHAAFLRDREQRIKSSQYTPPPVWATHPGPNPIIKSQSSGNQNGISSTQTGSYPTDGGGQREPATLGGTVKGVVWLGVFIAMGYAYSALHLSSWVDIGLFGLKGAIIGVFAGLALYLVIVVLRIVVTVVAAIIQFALGAGAIILGLYVLSKFF
jgi:hypothetical protein